MATAGPLEDHMTCTYCHQVYHDPHTLKCLHTFCLHCIKQLLQWNKVQCPECKEYSTNDVIRQDVKIQAFIDYYRKQNGSTPLINSESDIHNKSIIMCEMCEATDKPIKCKCVECHQFMCSSCEVTHRGMRICKNHTVRPIEDEIKSTQTKIKQAIIALEQQKQNADRSSVKIADTITEIRKSQTSQLADVNRYVDYLIRDMENYRQYLQQTIQESNESVINELINNQNSVDDLQKQLQVKVNSLNEKVESKDITVLTQTVQDMDIKVKDDVIKIQTTFLKEDMTSSVRIEKGEKWDLQKSLRVIVSDMSHLNHCQDENSKNTFSEISKYSFVEEKRDKLDNVPNRLCMIHDELWCAAEGVVYVYNKHCQRIKTIKHKNIQNVHGITHTHTGHIILGCHSNKGLKILDSTGKYLGQIQPGSYSDVSSYGESLYALEYSTHKLVCFEHVDNKWTKVKDIELNYTNGSTVDRVCVHSKGFYISSFFNHCIYIYTVDGKFQCQKGEEGMDTAGLLQSPSLCDVDNTGGALVADQGNHVLQVFDLDTNNWQVIRLPGDIKCPTHAVLDPTGHNIWVVTYNSRQLVKYVRT